MDKTIVNAAKCKLCGDIIESKHRHDFVKCKCGSIGVDGGHDYMRRIGNPENFIELYAKEDKMEKELFIKEREVKQQPKHTLKEAKNNSSPPISRGVRMNKPQNVKPRGRG
jgi:hypothetical protein